MNASEALYRLKPVTYRYKKEIDPKQSAAFGLIAEEVAEINPHLVARNSKGQPESVHYEMVNVMLLNEFLKEHKRVETQQSKIDQQQATITELKAEVAGQRNTFQTTAARHEKEIQALTASVKEQASQIQTVSSQIQMNRPTAEVVLNYP